MKKLEGFDKNEKIDLDILKPTYVMSEEEIIWANKQGKNIFNKNEKKNNNSKKENVPIFFGFEKLDENQFSKTSNSNIHESNEVKNSKIFTFREMGKNDYKSNLKEFERLNKNIKPNLQTNNKKNTLNGFNSIHFKILNNKKIEKKNDKIEKTKKIISKEKINNLNSQKNHKDLLEIENINNIKFIENKNDNSSEEKIEKILNEKKNLILNDKTDSLKNNYKIEDYLKENVINQNINENNEKIKNDVLTENIKHHFLYSKKNSIIQNLSIIDDSVFIDNRNIKIKKNFENTNLKNIEKEEEINKKIFEKIIIKNDFSGIIKNKNSFLKKENFILSPIKEMKAEVDEDDLFKINITDNFRNFKIEKKILKSHKEKKKNNFEKFSEEMINPHTLILKRFFK